MFDVLLNRAIPRAGLVVDFWLQRFILTARVAGSLVYGTIKHDWRFPPHNIYWFFVFIN
jgi:hypothetical protein